MCLKAEGVPTVYLLTLPLYQCIFIALTRRFQAMEMSRPSSIYYCDSIHTYSSEFVSSFMVLDSFLYDGVILQPRKKNFWVIGPKYLHRYATSELLFRPFRKYTLDWWQRRFTSTIKACKIFFNTSPEKRGRTIENVSDFTIFFNFIF